MQRNIKNLLFIASFTSVFIYCCKPEEGYISDYMYYRPKVLVAMQGVTTASTSIELDGGTGPASVKLLEIRNKLTGKPAPEFTKEYDVPQYLSQVTREDSTLELLFKKIALKPTPALSVNEVGGRVGLSPATANLDTGMYTLDVQVSNLKGTRIIRNAIDIHLVPMVSYSFNGAPFASHSNLGTEDGFITAETGVNVTRVPNGEDKIIIKFVDRTGKPFNPAAGEVVHRGDRGNLAKMNPYYPEEKTDTALVYRYPKKFPFPFLSSTNGFLSYYRVPGRFVDLNRNANVAFEFYINGPGTYILTVNLPFVNRKTP